MDSAFFSDDIVTTLDALENVEYCISVPFSRFNELKGFIENRQRWRAMNDRFKNFKNSGSLQAGCGATVLYFLPKSETPI